MGGQFDIWLPISEFLASDTYFLESSPYTTITEPGYVHSAVTVAGYQTSMMKLRCCARIMSRQQTMYVSPAS